MEPHTKEVVVRAGKTFVQTFLATWALTQFNFEKGALVGALAAGISAVWNILFPPAPTK